MGSTRAGGVEASHESILAFGEQGTAGLCWVRYFRVGEGVGLLLQDVAGNPGPPVESAVTSILEALARQWAIDPQTVTLVRVAVDGTAAPGLRCWQQGTHGAAWSDELPHALRGRVVTHCPTHPLWQAVPSSRRYLPQACQVGERLGQVWCLAPGSAWAASVFDRHHARAMMDFASCEAAQGWALQRLALLAREFDELPAWLNP